jgi:hypothetical protein
MRAVGGDDDGGSEVDTDAGAEADGGGDFEGANCGGPN